MLAKGPDFPNITLVGIICADLSLNFPDFRATERTYQLLAQVSGRAGRAELSGHVILQTYSPEHFSIRAAKKQDYNEFYNQEIVFRNSLKYPPYSRIILLKISGTDPKRTEFNARLIGEWCLDLTLKFPEFKNNIEILGPVGAGLYRVANRYRWQILLKSQVTSKLHLFVRNLVSENFSKLNSSTVRVSIDVDPFLMM